jgi:uncharacterized protein (TIGR02145 family)
MRNYLLLLFTLFLTSFLTAQPTLEDINDYHQDDRIKAELITGPDGTAYLEDGLNTTSVEDASWYMVKVAYLWDVLKNNFNADPETAGTYLETGLRYKYAFVKQYATMEITQKIFGYNTLFLNQKDLAEFTSPELETHLRPYTGSIRNMGVAHEENEDLNLNSKSAFGFYNSYAVSNIRMGVDDMLRVPVFKKIAQKVYNQRLKSMAHTYYEAYFYINRDRPYLEQLQKEYLDEVFSEGGTEDGSLQETFRDFADAMEQEKQADWYEAVTAPAFWLRRSIDGTDEQFINILETLIKSFEPGFQPIRDYVDYSAKNYYYDGSRMTDPRDGKIYKVYTLKDGKTWMVENLNYDMEGSYCFNDDQADGDLYCYDYGRFYTKEAAQKACPPGWYLPSDEEWWNMISIYGNIYNTEEGQEKNTTTDAGKTAFESLVKGGYGGFSAILGGRSFDFESYRDYSRLGIYGTYWTSSEIKSNNNELQYPYYRFSNGFDSSPKRIIRMMDGEGSGSAFGCRCVQGNDISKSKGTFKDQRDDQTYTWAKMEDGKIWMTENLNYKTANSWCYDNEEGQCQENGRLYNAAASKNACPDGWHLATDEEWQNLTKAYGGYRNGFDNTNVGNPKQSYAALLSGGESGFNARLVGYRNYNGEFIQNSRITRFYASNGQSYRFWDYRGVIRSKFVEEMGFSCRCVKD